MTQETPPGAVGSMVCGIISLVMFWVPVVGLVLGIIAIVLSNKARRDAVENPDLPTGMATAGLVMGIIGTVIGAFWTIYLIIAFIFIGAAVNEANEHYNGAIQLPWDAVVRRYF